MALQWHARPGHAALSGRLAVLRAAGTVDDRGADDALTEVQLGEVSELPL